MDARGGADDRELARRDALLLEGLRQALTGDEHRLFRSGKAEGLFATRTGLSGEAAELALREGLLEYARTESRGRFEIEWVRLTPKGVEYLYNHDSPRAILLEMRAMLQVAQSGIPKWQDEMLRALEHLASDVTSQMAKYLARLDALTKRIEEGLRRMEAGPDLSPAVQGLVPWAVDALRYLDQRRKGAGVGDCPLPELFGAVHALHPKLTIREFHDGLRRLADNHALQLFPWSGPGPIPKPEFALMIGGKLTYLVRR